MQGARPELILGLSANRMDHKHEAKDLQSLVSLGREQGYLTFDQVNDFLPQDVASAGDLRAALGSFEGMDIKVLDEVPGESTGAEAEAGPKEEPEEESVDDFSESSDPVRLYLKEMGQFQLLTRVGEVEVARRLPGQRPASSAPVVAVDVGWSGAAVRLWKRRFRDGGLSFFGRMPQLAYHEPQLSAHPDALCKNFLHTTLIALRWNSNYAGIAGGLDDAERASKYCRTIIKFFKERRD